MSAPNVRKWRKPDLYVLLSLGVEVSREEVFR